MNKAMQEAPKPLRGRMYQRDNARPKENRILVLKTGVAGVQFHIRGEAEAEALRNLAPGTELMLYRDPDNEKDKWAIGVYLTETDQLGHITRFKNEPIARLMDVGKRFVAVVDDIETNLEAKDIVNKQVRERQAPTENMAVPISVYMIEEM